jgi:hypothetical protein
MTTINFLQMTDLTDDANTKFKWQLNFFLQMTDLTDDSNTKFKWQMIQTLKWQIYHIAQKRNSNNFFICGTCQHKNLVWKETLKWQI